MEYIKENIAKIIATVITIAVAFAVYFLFIPQSGSVKLEIADANRAEVNRTVTMLHDLKHIKINKEVFSNTVFTSLQDDRKELPQYSIGNTNPFSPLSTSTLERMGVVHVNADTQGDTPTQDGTQVVEEIDI